MIAAPSSEGLDLDKLRHEAAELPSLGFISQLKLRQYVDLGKEVKQLGLMTYLPDRAPSSSYTGGSGHAHAISGISLAGTIDGTYSVPTSPGTPARWA